MSNVHVERVFSQLNVIKTNRRTCLGEDRLDSLLQIATTGRPLSEWDSSHAVELWWSDKKRRNVENIRAPPKKQLHSEKESTDTDNDTESTLVSPDGWEDWALSV